MSTPKAAIVEIPFQRGLRQDVARPFVPLGGLLQADNLEFDAQGSLKRRDGFHTGAMTKYSKDNSYFGPALRFGVGPHGENVIFCGTNTFLYDVVNDRTEEAGPASQVLQLKASVTGHFTTGFNPETQYEAGTGTLFCDAGSYGGILLVAYTQSMHNGVNWNILLDAFDADGNAVLTQYKVPFLEPSPVQPPRIVVTAAGVAFVLSVNVGGKIEYCKVDLAAATLVPGTVGTLITDLDNAATFQSFDASPTWDGAALNGLVLAYAADVAGTKKTHITTFSGTPAVLNGPYIWTSSLAANMRVKAISVVGAPTGSDHIFAAATDTAGLGIVEGLAISATLTGAAKGYDTWSDARDQFQIVCSRMSIDKAMIAYGSPTAGGPSTGGRLRIATLSSAGVWCGGGGNVAQLTAGYAPASKFFTDSGTHIYIWGVYFDAAVVQRHYMLFACGSGSTLQTPSPIARVGNGMAADVFAALAGAKGPCTPNVPATTADHFVFANVLNIGASVLSGQTVGLWNVRASGPDRFLNLVAHGNMHIAGGAPLCYDGQRMVESQFFHYPDPIVSGYVRAAAGGGMQAGIYQYRFVWEWCDAAGLRHQSPASAAVTVDMSGAPYAGNVNTVTWTIPPIHATRKMFDKQKVGIPRTESTRDNASPILLIMYRTAAGSSGPFYRSPFVALNTVDVTTIPLVPITLVDTGPSTSNSGNEQLYVSRGSLVNDAGPPCLQMTMHQSRMWGLDSEDPERVWCSKLFEDLEAMAPSAALSVPIPGCGRVNGVASQDGKLYALCTAGIWLASYGDGPGNTGQGAFPEPMFLTAAAMCDEPRSVFIATGGIYFSGPGHWGTTIYLLRRGDGTPIDIGKRVRDELASCPVVRGIVERIDKARIEVLVVDDDVSATIGKLLYYHYDLPDEEGIGQWTVATPYGGAALNAVGVFPKHSISLVASATAVGVQGDLYATGGYDGIVVFFYLLQTGDIRPFGLVGYGGVHSVTLLATSALVSSTSLTIDASYDLGHTFPDVALFPAMPEAAGYPQIKRWEPPTKKLAHGFVRYRMTDQNEGGIQGPILLHALVLETLPLGSTVRLAQGSMT